MSNTVTEMSSTMPIQILSPLATVPTRGSLFAAGYDLYAAIQQTTAIPPHGTVKIGTGIAFQVPDTYFGAVFARSGLATKQGLRPANCVGVIDPDYRGEVIVALHNDTNEEKVINPGDRIAQIVFIPFQSFDFQMVHELEDTGRGDGGFGSTGI